MIGKRIALVVLIAVLLLSLLACRDRKENVDASGSDKSTADSIQVTDSSAGLSETGLSETAASSLLPVPGEDASIADKIEYYMQTIEFHGVVFAAREGEVIFEQAYGLADHKTEEPNSTDTIFELGSITKQFTAAGIMLLVEQEKISLDDTLDMYVPEYSYADSISIRNLLNMTSGIPDYVTSGAMGMDMDVSQEFSLELMDQAMNILTKEYTQEEIISIVSDQELLFEPGSDWSYGNTDYFLLGMVIERVSGVTYDEFISANFFEPLEMTSTSMNIDDLTSSGVFLLPNVELYLPSQDESLTFSAGAICSTAHDLYLWELAVLRGDFLSAQSWEEIFDPGEFGYGYGWTIAQGNYYHGGQTAGYNTMVMIVPETDVIIIVLSNTQGPDMVYIDGKVKSSQIAFSIFYMFESEE
jgi:CubicO group peptidase (beta-lactamase class C family)